MKQSLYILLTALTAACFSLPTLALPTLEVLSDGYYVYEEILNRNGDRNILYRFKKEGE
jgi:hypothetical protein